jgi:hypothetical protein
MHGWTSCLGGFLVIAAVLLRAGEPATAEGPASNRSHLPQRPLPRPSARPLAAGPAFFVDPVRGADQNKGTQPAPWRTIGHALKQMNPGDTLYLRGGTYYGCVTVSVCGTVEKPITLRAYPGELAILDGGIREFAEDAAHAWEPYSEGADGEFRSTKSYTQGGGFGNFADSMVPFQRYLTFADLRSTNELLRKELANRADDSIGIYAGPGVRRDPTTGRIHVRLAHTKLAGLGNRHYRGETDPRRLPLVISGHDYTLRIEGARHLRVQDLVVRGAERAAVLIAEDAEDTEQDAEDIELNGLTLYGSGSALRVSRTRGLRVLHCALRGHAAPWHSRFHHKDRAGAGYLVMAAGRDFEFAHCELTDHHDCMQFHFVDGLRFHHNLVDNFNDDGLEPGPKKERGTTYIYQNVITRCLNPLTAHGKKAAPVQSAEGSGLYVCRNIFDLRDGTYKAPPTEPDPSGAFLNQPTICVGHDHGNPTWANYYFYHNTCLLPGSAVRDYYAFMLGSHTQGTRRRVFNNIFIQVKGLPGLNFAGSSVDDDFQADGNLLWSLRDGPKHPGDFFTTWRQSALFAASKKRLASGWGAHDLFAEPKLIQLEADSTTALDPRLQSASPAVDAGVELPASWFDPLRNSDKGKPDLGALPLGVEIFPTGL